MFKTEKQLNKKATKIAIEEIFTKNEVVNNEYDSSVGYRFNYPTRWLADPSQNKMIGIRRLKIIPAAYYIVLRITAKIFDKTTTLRSVPLVRDFTIMSENKTEEILNKICSEFTWKTTYDDPTIKNINYYLAYTYNYEDNSVKFYIKSDYTEDPDKTFKFTIGTGANNPDTEKFLKFMNQPVNTINIANLNTYTDYKTFHNVWDRNDLYFHASFSTSKRQYIGINNDFYMAPNKLFSFPTNTSEFTIRFTTDGIKNILPLYSNFIIELIFIINYEKSIVL